MQKYSFFSFNLLFPLVIAIAGFVGLFFFSPFILKLVAITILSMMAAWGGIMFLREFADLIEDRRYFK